MKYDPERAQYHVEHEHLSPELGARIVEGFADAHARARLRHVLARVRGARRRSVRDRLHESGAGHGHQLAHAALLRVGGAAHGRPGDPAREERRRASESRARRIPARAARRAEHARPPSAQRRHRRSITRSSTDELAGETRSVSSTSSSRARAVLRRPPALLRAAPALLSPRAVRDFSRARRRACCAPSARRTARRSPTTRCSTVPAHRLGARSSRTSIPAFATRARCRGSTRSSSTRPSGLRFTEYNAETPAGGAYNDVLTEVFFGAAGDARVRAALGCFARCRRATTCCTRCSTPTRSSAGTHAKPAHRDRRLARRADATASSCSSRTTSERRGSSA